jgi:peptidyl-tRNA hydrolase
MKMLFLNLSPTDLDKVVVYLNQYDKKHRRMLVVHDEPDVNITLRLGLEAEGF